MSSIWRASLIVLALPAACSSSGDGPKDAAADVRNDIAFPSEDATTDAPSVCGPVDVTGYQPTPLVPPNAPHGAKCTSQEIVDYAQCQGAKVTSLCKQFADGQSGQACRQCIETQTTDARWGVIVFAGSGTGNVNIEGCVDDALGQTSKEKASGGSGSCGDALFASYGCQTEACGACDDGAFGACTQTALDNGCKSYDQAVQSTTGPCSALLSDASPPDANACFPDTSITDPTQQEVDWLTRIVGYMCGP